MTISRPGLSILIAAVLAAAPLSRPAAAGDGAFAYPDTNAGHRAEAVVEAINDGSEEALRAFDAEQRAESARQKRPIDEMLPMMLQMSRMTGALEPHSITASSDNEMELLVRFTAMDGWGKLWVKCDDDPPHKLTSMRIVPAGPPEVEAASFEEWENLEDLLTQAIGAADLPAAACAVVDGDRITERAVAGVRLRGAPQPVRVDDRFHLGSVTKSMTATMVGRLVELDLVEWDDTLGETLSGIEMRPEYRAVTVEQLLQHIAGIPQHLTYDDPEMDRLVNLPGTPPEQRAAFAAEVLLEEPIAAPATRSNYSNAGYAIVGLVAERAAGSSWEALMREQVFEPLDMKTAVIGWPATESRPDQPRGHFPDHPQALDEYPLGGFMAPAGDVSCSISDLARYARLHLWGLNGVDGALRAETIERLHTPLLEDGTYAAGWSLKKTDSGEVLHWHNGSAGTFYALVAIDPEQDRAVVVAMNTGFAAQPLAWKIVDALNARTPQEAESN